MWYFLGGALFGMILKPVLRSLFIKQVRLGPEKRGGAHARTGC